METTNPNEITIHKALSELKTLDSRIDKATKELLTNAIYQKDKKIGGVYTEAEFKERAEKAYASVNGLIERKQKIKRLIVESNAKTKVTIGGKEMTVADAITFKSISLKKAAVIKQMQTNFDHHSALLNKKNEEMADRCDKVVVATVGADAAKAKGSEVEQIEKNFRTTNEWHLADPLKVQDKIKEMDEELGKFVLEVDDVLSTSNAITKISV